MSQYKPSEEELNNMHWKDRWEYEARKDFEAYLKLSEDELLEKLRTSGSDFYYQRWRAFEKKGSIKKSAIPLWEFIKNHPGESMMLHRFHASTALFKILGIDIEDQLKKSIQWSHDGEEMRQKALGLVKEIIDKKISED